MRKKIKNLFFCKWVNAVAAFITALLISVNYGLRTSYVFIDTTVFSGFAMTILSLATAASAASLLLFAIKAKKNGVDEYSMAVKILSVMLLVFSVFFAVYTIGIYIGSGVETQQYANLLIVKAMPYTLAGLAIVFLAVVMPHIKKETAKKAISTIMVLSVLVSGIFLLFPFCSYKITCDPMVVDNGTDYAIVFATNDKGTGWVEYEYNNEKVIKYDEKAGRLETNSKVHTINVPKQELTGCSYRVGSKRVIADLSYGSRTGKEICSDYYNFEAPQGDNQAYLTVSDWHTRLDKAYAVCAYAGDYDGVILLGDPGAGLMTENDIITNIVEFGGRLCGGVKPIIYVRGNHETRGCYAAELPEYLGMDSFYYSTVYGNNEFIVLDSGEDKDDSHPEYGGLDNYNQYRKDMIDWLSAKQSTPDKNVFVLVHSYDVCIEEDLSKTAYSNFNRLGVSQLVSGHLHKLDYFEKDGIRVYVDGGITSGTKEYIANKITLNGDNYTIEGWNQNGEKVFDQAFTYQSAAD